MKEQKIETVTISIVMEGVPRHVIENYESRLAQKRLRLVTSKYRPDEAYSENMYKDFLGDGKTVSETQAMLGVKASLLAQDIVGGRLNFGEFSAREKYFPKNNTLCKIGVNLETAQPTKPAQGWISRLWHGRIS